MARRSKGDGNDDRLLIVRERNGSNVFVISADKLGPPINHPKLNKMINEHKNRGISLSGLDFAVMTDTSDVEFRSTARNSGGGGGPPKKAG